MIGVVWVRAPEARRVAGLALPMRALLCLQAAGVEALGFVGEAAERWAAVASQDDRVRLPVRAYGALPSEAHLVLDGSVAVDARAARALASRPGVLFSGNAVVGAHRAGPYEGEPLDDVGDGAIDPGPSVLVPVRDDASARSAEDALFATLRKPQDGIVSRAINRSLSLAVTRVLCRTELRPNQLSLAILSFGLAGGVLAALGPYGPLALGGVCFQAQSVLDGCDGELSRLTFRGSRTGEWLDTVGDDVTNYAFFLGASYGLSRAGFGALALALGAVGVGAGVIASGIEYRYLLKIGSGDLLKYPLGFGADPDPVAPRSPIQRLLGAARPLFKRDFFAFATMLAAILGSRATLGMMSLFAVGAVFTLVAVLRSEWSRRGRVP